MHKNKLSLISLILAIVMIAGALAACGGGEDVTTEAPVKETTESVGNVTTEQPSEETTEKKTETEGEKETEEVTEPVIEGLVGPYAEVIENANNLANVIHDYPLRDKGAYSIVNNNMTLEYLLNSTYDQQISSLKNTQGKSYIENTFDVFVKMTNGKTFYASKSSVNATPNVFRYGYYYNEVRFEGQDFLNGTTIFKEANYPMYIDYANQLSTKSNNGLLKLIVKDASDPYVSFLKPGTYSTDDYKYVRFTMKNSIPGTTATVYIISGELKGYGAQGIEFSLHSDDEYHDYDIYLGNLEGYTGDLKQIRLDLNGFNKGEGVELTGIKVFNAEANGIATLSVARIFHSYSDKLHHEVQLVAHEDTSDVAEVGVITRIPTDTVDKIIVKDKNGTYDTLDAVDWESAEYIGFDIKEAGVFGYILPVAETTGKMTVTLEDGCYVIVQSRAPEFNEIIAGDNKRVGNTNDFYMGQRLYTDENHTFDAFIVEAEIERNPLTAKNIKVSTAYSDTGVYFVGYDPIRGSYEFYLPGTDFNAAYYGFPNRRYELNFTIRGDKYDRNVYILATTDSPILECAVVLDEDLVMLPIPIETGKNFPGDGDNNIYDLLDTGYSDAIFPIIVTGDKALEYNVVHLYQNWGNYPLKQTSFIEYHFPYYHFSTGVTETNCISLYAGRTGNFLPDHRGMSAPLWDSQPQHTSAGHHTIFSYMTDDSKFIGASIEEKYIDSYGPTYADLTMKFLSSDGKVVGTYTHMEMPQTDENRGYYTIEIDFLEDISFKNFRDSFSLYTVSDNDPEGQYQYFGYLNENNEPTLVDANIKGPKKTYVLGTEAPYFDYCYMVGCKGSGGPGGTYGNVSFIICDSEIIIGGEKVTPNFAVTEGNLVAKLTLDLGRVKFQAGDKITINALITPWGSQESDYSGKNFAPDQNVRDLRENSALNPFKATAGENAEVIESAFIPKVRTTNGKSAEFTISGGENNVAIRVYGFKDLSVPKVYEKVNGEWVEYQLSSANNPDVVGYAFHYDGYAVYYDGDYTYSYSFVTTITDGAPRTFKIETAENFKGWPRIDVEDPVENKLPLYFDPMTILKRGTEYYGTLFYKSCEVMNEDKAQFTHLVPRIDGSKYNESYLTYYTYNEEDPIVSGQYFVIKYRTNATENEYFEIFTSTVNTGAQAGDYSRVLSVENKLYIPDGEWHTVVIDLSAVCNTFNADADGNYIAKYLRVDTSQGHDAFTNHDIYVDIAFVGVTGDLEEAVTIDTSLEDILFYDGILKVYDPITGEPK